VIRPFALLLAGVAATSPAASPAPSLDSGAGATTAPAAQGASQDSWERLCDHRLDPDALDEAIDELLAQAVADTQSYRARILLARAEAFWAELHADAAPEEIDAHLRTGVRVAGEALAASSPRYAVALAKGKTLLAMLSEVEPSGAEALYWIADDQHRLAAAHGLARLLLEEPELRRLFKRVNELVPGTFYGGAALHLAELDLALPTGFGAGLVPVAAELASALRLGPNQLETHLVWAERWAVKAQDYRVFQREIAAIEKASLDAAPEIRPENELVKRKAKKLMQSVPELFTRAAITSADAGTPF
jgi:hypothetical protein